MTDPHLEMMRDLLRKAARTPATWFACAFAFSYTLPGLLAEIKRKEQGFATSDGGLLEGLLSVARSYYLLAGYAAENFVKGLWVAHALATGRSLGGPTKKAPVPPRALVSHDLVKLATESKLPLSPPELKDLAKLQRAIIWWAKYPVPLDAPGFELFGTGTGEAESVRDLLRHLERLVRAYSANQGGPWPPDASTVQAGW